MKHRALSDAMLRTIVPDPSKVIKVVDGNGLALHIRPNGRRIWSLRLTRNGRDSTQMLGEYPTMSLGAARKEADVARHAQTPVAIASTISFRECYEQWLSGKAIADKYKTDIQGRIEANCGTLMSRPIASITIPEVIACCKKISDRGSYDQARRVRRLLQEIFDFALIHQWIQSNPAPAALNKVLPSRKRTNFTMTEVADAPAIFSAIRAYPSIIVGNALALLVLAAMRTKEVRLLEWNMVDFERRAITLPASLMKMNREHRIPMSNQALALLKSTPRLSDRLVFPSPRAMNRPLSDMALLSVMKSLNGATTHGWRATFSSWANANQIAGRDIVEVALSHYIGGIAGAYDRSDRYAARQDLMQKWSNFLDG